MSGFRKAEVRQAYLKLLEYGPPGTGKTFTGLLIAEGLARHMGKRIAVVDTEEGSSLYSQRVPQRRVHPEAFDFDALHSRSITEVAREIYALDLNKYGVVMLDSLTHLWESTKNAYHGRTNRAGQIPFHEWGKIKKPYKDLISWLLSAKLHVIFCGRQGIDYRQGQGGESEVVGYKVKAETDSAYEPHVVIRMEQIRGRDHEEPVIQGFVEKDRSGLLSGRVIQWPDFASVAAPLLPLLGMTQAAIPTEDEVASQDAEAMGHEEKEKKSASKKHLEQFAAKLTLAKTTAEVEKVSQSITPGVKKEMLAADVAALREKYLEASRRVKAAPEAPPSQAVPAPTDGGNGHALPHSGGPLDRLDNEQYARLNALAKAKGGLEKWLPRLGSKSLAALPPGLYEHALLFLELDDLSVKDFLDYYQLQGLSQLSEERRGHALGLLRRGVSQETARP
jgi:hypothetical protein